MASEEPIGQPILLRAARRADLPAIVAIEEASFAIPWSAGAFRSVLARPDAVLLVADAGGEVVGHAAAWFAGDEGELADLAVRPAERGRGIGRRLVEEVRSVAVDRGVRDLYLQVRESNATARRLYASSGFRPVGRRRSYYRSPREDALVLRWRSPGAEVAARSPSTR